MSAHIGTGATPTMGAPDNEMAHLSTNTTEGSDDGEAIVEQRKNNGALGIAPVQDKASNTTTNKPSAEPTKKPCPFLEKIPPEVRLKIYGHVFEDLHIDADSSTLDTTITHPSILEVNKLIRSEAMKAYVDGIFTAFINTRQELVALRKKSTRAMDAAQRTPVHNFQRHGELMLTASSLVTRGHTQMLHIAQHAN